mmetsp:Transcript_22534/g.56807  ORF Transcript_22534/g.56807 Transcript_22534/m.56807 type:complete len:238 (+) Transcript_22534:151-864(+)
MSVFKPIGNFCATAERPASLRPSLPLTSNSNASSDRGNFSNSNPTPSSRHSADDAFSVSDLSLSVSFSASALQKPALKAPTSSFSSSKWVGKPEARGMRTSSPSASKHKLNAPSEVGRSATNASTPFSPTGTPVRSKRMDRNEAGSFCERAARPSSVINSHPARVTSNSCKAGGKPRRRAARLGFRIFVKSLRSSFNAVRPLSAAKICGRPMSSSGSILFNRSSKASSSSSSGGLRG